MTEHFQAMAAVLFLFTGASCETTRDGSEETAATLAEARPSDELPCDEAPPRPAPRAVWMCTD
jgi:hypothetical protein